MTGHLYRNNARLSKAYAEGMDAKTGAVNPHAVGSPAYEAWAAGYAATSCAGFAGSARCSPGAAPPNGHVPVPPPAPIAGIQETPVPDPPAPAPPEEDSLKALYPSWG